MQAEPEIYLSAERYQKLVDALVNAAPCPFTGAITADQIMLVLGLNGDIWPEGSGVSGH